jgi:hypothetical protein
MIRLLSTIFFTLIFSCTIIEDSDITSQAELDNLRFKSIEIRQETGTGSSTIVARVTADSVVNIPVPGGIITRTLWMDWPAMGSKKLKLRGGFTGPFKSYTSFLASGKPFTFYLFDADSTILEVYRFRYRSDGRLNNIIYDQANFVRISNDSLVYSMVNVIVNGNPKISEEVTSIIRRSPDPSKAGTFSITSGAISNLESFNFKGTTFYQRPNPQESSYYSFPPNTTGGTNTNYGLVAVEDFQKQFLRLIDRNNITDDCNCSKWIDTFYFHPLMILMDQLVYECFCGPGNQFRLGEALLLLYMVDWWRPVSGQEATKDESVTFTFKYGL